jgi:diadenosine tetraphosphate (Ap4A) HIT family hydrolase
MLTPEQTEQVKKQVIQQIDSTFPEDKKEPAKNQIKAMDSKQLEKFLEQNKLIKQETGEQKCIFCSIVFGDIPSYKIDENEKAIAVLEINPISRGHSLVIPKDHIASKENLPSETFSLAKDISKRIKTKLKPKEVKLASANLFGHEVLNIIPIYKDETPESERKPLNPEELLGLQKLLEKEPPKKIPKRAIKKIRSKEKLWLPKRIP